MILFFRLMIYSVLIVSYNRNVLNALTLLFFLGSVGH